MANEYTKQILERAKELIGRLERLSRIEFFAVIMAILGICGVYFVKSDAATIAIPIFVLLLVWSVIYARAKQID